VQAAAAGGAEGRRRDAGEAVGDALVALAVNGDQVARSAGAAGVVRAGQHSARSAADAVRRGLLASHAVRRAGLAGRGACVEELVVLADGHAEVRGVEAVACLASGARAGELRTGRAVRVALEAVRVAEQESSRRTRHASVRRVVHRLARRTARAPRSSLLAGHTVRIAAHIRTLHAVIR